MLLNRTEGRSSCIFELVPLPGSNHLWKTVTRFYPLCSYLLNSTIRNSLFFLFFFFLDIPSFSTESDLRGPDIIFTVQTGSRDLKPFA